MLGGVGWSGYDIMMIYGVGWVSEKVWGWWGMKRKARVYTEITYNETSARDDEYTAGKGRVGIVENEGIDMEGKGTEARNWPFPVSDPYNSWASASSYSTATTLFCTLFCWSFFMNGLEIWHTQLMIDSHSMSLQPPTVSFNNPLPTLHPGWHTNGNSTTCHPRLSYLIL